MQAASLTGIRHMQTVDVPAPALVQPDDVLLRLAVVGICGSDVHYYTTGRIGSQVVQYPFIVGHECAAVVERVGTAVQRVRPGDRVAVEPAVACGTCDQCRVGRPHTCRHLQFLGCPGQIAGCLCEWLVMPERCCFPLPPAMTLTDAALCEPLAIGMYAAKLSGAGAGARLGILGLGPIGLSIMLAARARGAAAIYGSDPRDYRARLALAHGATWTGNPATDDIVGRIADQEPGLLDVVFECCGQQTALDQALDLVKPGGKVMVVGIPEFDRFSFAADVARRKEICLQHVRRQNDCVQAAIDAVATGAIRPQFMVTHHLPLRDCQRGFDLVDQYADGVVKAMVTF